MKLLSEVLVASLAAFVVMPNVAVAGDFVDVGQQSSPLRIERFDFQDSAMLHEFQASGGVNRFKVDGVEIVLTREDAVKAKNWKLNGSDWAKYKYAMEYTPRGTWSPNLDPPIVLGNMAKTEFERSRYAKIAMDLEIDRRNREEQFNEAGIEYLGSINPNFSNVNKPITGLELYLGPGKKKLRSLFIDPSRCDDECLDFIDGAYASTSSVTQLYIYIVGANKVDAQSWVERNALSAHDLERKSVKVVRDDKDLHEEYIGNGKLPFYVHQTDGGVTLRYASDGY